MKIWKTEPQLQNVIDIRKETLVDLLGIEFIEVGDDFLKARMPVDRRTIQPMGVLHGGASCVLAETLASVAACHCVDSTQFYCVGLEININHLRRVDKGHVTGIAKPIHLGKTTQVWEIKLFNDQDQLVAISRMTAAVLEIRDKS